LFFFDNVFVIIAGSREHSIIHFVIILSHEKSNKNSDHVHSSSSIAMTRLCNVFHHTIEISLILMLLKIMKVIPLPVQICTSQLLLISVMTMPMLVMMIVILNLNCTFSLVDYDGEYCDDDAHECDAAAAAMTGNDDDLIS